MRNVLALLALLSIILPAQVRAEVSVGEEIPHNLELKDQNGDVRTFESLSGENGAVLVFIRSADWCPYCQVQLLDLRTDGQPIIDAGYNIVSVSYDAPEALKTFADKYRFPYVMLSDDGSEAIKAFGILNEDFASDHFAYGVPYPHVYIVGTDKVVRHVLAEDGYRDRPQIDAILEKIVRK